MLALLSTPVVDGLDSTSWCLPKEQSRRAWWLRSAFGSMPRTTFYPCRRSWRRITQSLVRPKASG